LAESTILQIAIKNSILVEYFFTKNILMFGARFYKMKRSAIIIHIMAGFPFFVTFQKIDFPSHLSKYSYYCIFWQVALVLSIVTPKGELISGQDSFSRMTLFTEFVKISLVWPR